MSSHHRPDDQPQRAPLEARRWYGIRLVDAAEVLSDAETWPTLLDAAAELEARGARELVGYPRRMMHLVTQVRQAGLPVAWRRGRSHKANQPAVVVGPDGARLERVLRGETPEADARGEAEWPMIVKGKSILRDADGNVRLTWTKTRLDDEQRLDAVRLLANEWAGAVQGLGKASGRPQETISRLATVYPMGDPHIGLYAWAEEAGEDFDVAIAERDIVAAVTRLTQAAPASEVGVVLNLGDYFHTDTADNRTSRSGHALDVDTRWARVMQVGARVMLRVVEAALLRHRKVIVRNVIGNHDDHSSVALSLIMDAYWAAEARVKVDLSPARHWYWRHGKCLIGATHGDQGKLADLPGVMAVDRARDWGETAHRYWYTGHVHHTSRLERHGAVVESFRTLAPRDAWSAGMGYRSGRDMHAIVLDAEYGEVQRHRVDITRARGTEE